MKPIRTILAAIFVIVVCQGWLLNAQLPVEWIIAASYAPDGAFIAIVGKTQDFSGLFIFDIAGREQARIEMREANGVAWGLDGRLAVRWFPEGELDHVISILDAQTREETVRVDALFPVDAPEILWSPDGRMLLHYRQSNYQVWDTAGGSLISENALDDAGPRPIQDAFWHPLTQELYILDLANHILVFDPLTGKQTREPFVLEIQPGGTEGYLLHASQIEITSDGSQIAVAFNDTRQTMQVIDTDTGETIHLFNAPDPEYDIRELRWITDGQSIATQSSTRRIDFWNVESGELQQTLSNFDIGIPSIQTFVFHPDRTQIAIVGADTSANLEMHPPATDISAIALMPATAVLLNLDQIPISMRAPN